MSIDKNSIEYRLGTATERLWAERLRKQYPRVTRPNGQPVDVDYCGNMDLKATDRFGSVLYEVKFRSNVFMYSDTFPCYTFPVYKIEQYKNSFKNERDIKNRVLIIYDWKEKKYLVVHLAT